jgi:lipopolysaccharide biosynthesis glycosyltransferase
LPYAWKPGIVDDTEDTIAFQKTIVQNIDDAPRRDIAAAGTDEARALHRLTSDGRLVDARWADSQRRDEPATAVVENESTSREIISTETISEPRSEATDGTTVLVVIISNRRDGIVPMIASILLTSSLPVDVVLIGVHEINQQVKEHFGNRIHEFTSLSVQDIEDDLVQQGFQPIWTWPEWHTSMDPSWKNENTLHVGVWDNLETHAHELNHIRFYLPHVSVFQGKDYFYFMDDDLLVHKDLGVLAKRTMDDLDPKRGLVCACNIWMWNSECFHFEFQTKKDYILSMPSLYGDRDVCKTESESHCVPANYWDFVASVMPEGGKDQHAWNFGFSLFALQNWRDLQLTEKYEHVMKESYRLHVFPETSLTFGLGVSYIAFAGNVECWDEEYVKVRDGFGFIEWDRYTATFGDDFYDDVAVAHYTGPDKPWVPESRIELRANEPWLKMMEQENMPIPPQLPLEPTENLFTLLGSDRSGAHWIMSLLDNHPQVCASGESDKPETGFPADVLLPEGLPWYPYCSIKRGCTYDFVSKMVNELAPNPYRCAEDYDSASDPLYNHLPRLCNFVKALGGNFDPSNVARLWVDAFVREDKALLGCGCVRGVKAKGLKVMTEWIFPRSFPHDLSKPAFVNLNNTKVHGSKIIRLKRKNIWARYKSMLMAQQTGMYHPTTPGDKKSQIASLKDIDVDVAHMEWHMKRMEALDRAGDVWAKEHASDVLWLDYDDCRANTADCFTRIYQFVGVDTSHVTKKSSSYESSFASFAGAETTLEFIRNKGKIMELLGVNGWDHYVSGEKYMPIQFLIYEESDLVIDSRQYLGINTTLYGQEPTAYGHGNRFTAVLPILKQMDPAAIVVLSSDRDGRVNFPVGNHDLSFGLLYEFRKKFENMTKDFPGSIVTSTDSDCCTSALTHAKPGDFFSTESKRTSRACMSGEADCEWDGDQKARPWMTFMEELATKRSDVMSNIYLDSSLLVGKASSLINVFEVVDIQKLEDDRAVLTDFMYRNPNLIVLDYEQLLLGENRKMPRNPLKKQCFVSSGNTGSILRHLDFVPTEKQPLFMYSPRDLGCGDTEKYLAPSYPLWDKKGIVLQPILDHINRVVENKASIVLPKEYGFTEDYTKGQGPEVVYFMDNKGVWSSNLIRDRTSNETTYWRMLPTEQLVRFTHEVLMKEVTKSGRWDRLKEAIRSGGFPFWSWYVSLYYARDLQTF